MAECICHYSSTDRTEPLVTLNTTESQNTLNVAQLRQHQKISSQLGSAQ